MKALIEASVAMAQRHRHPEVVPDHVTAAIAENDAWWRLRIVPVVRPELGHLVDARLASLVTSGTYRDHVARPRLTERTESLFAPSKWLRREINLPIILKRLDGETPLFKEVMSGVHSISNEVRAAFHVVDARKHTTLRVDHVLWVVSEREWFRRALVMAGGALDAFTAALDERLTRLECGASTRAVSPELEELIDECRLHERGGKVDALVEAALLRDRVKPLFTSSGASVAVLGDLLVDGVLRR